MAGVLEDRKGSTTVTTNGAVAAEYGFPSDHFDFPYQVTTDDAVVTGYDFGANEDRPYAFESNESSEAFRPAMPDASGEYSVDYLNAPQAVPSNDRVSIVPAAGSQDLAEPMDTPYYAPGTNRIIHSDGPVTGRGDSVDYGVATIGREMPGQSGPVSGDGGGYSWQLAASYAASQYQAYSEQAVASALVAAV